MASVENQFIWQRGGDNESELELDVERRLELGGERHSSSPPTVYSVQNADFRIEARILAPVPEITTGDGEARPADAHRAEQVSGDLIAECKLPKPDKVSILKRIGICGITGPPNFGDPFRREFRRPEVFPANPQI